MSVWVLCAPNSCDKIVSNWKRWIIDQKLINCRSVNKRTICCIDTKPINKRWSIYRFESIKTINLSILLVVDKIDKVDNNDTKWTHLYHFWACFVHFRAYLSHYMAKNLSFCILSFIKSYRFHINNMAMPVSFLSTLDKSILFYPSKRYGPFTDFRRSLLCTPKS